MIHSTGSPVEDRLLRTLPVRIGKRAAAHYTQVYHHFIQLTPCAIPPTGPAIVVCNHISGLDPFLLQTTTERVITWMMAREYYEMKFAKWFFKAIDAIPVDRGGRDLASTRSALRTLQQGRVLGIFPEGRIASDPQALGPFHTGAALLALKTGAPVVPACLEGTARGTEMLQAFFTPARMAVAYGPPVQLPSGDTSRETLEQAADRIHAAVASLRQQFSSEFNDLF